MILTSGVFSLDGQDFDVENNVWLLGNDDEVLVIDAAHDAEAIRSAIGGRRLVGVLCTHGHNDHVNAAVEVAGSAEIWLHPADRMLWDVEHPDAAPTAELAEGDLLTVAGTELRVLHTPGHSPGAVSVYAPGLDTVFTGDTLFAGGPGATGRSFSSFPTIIDSIRDRLLTLPAETTVHTGHGDSTSIGAESPSLAEWIERGH